MALPITPAPSGASIKLSPATAGSIILLVAFFLPWINFFGISVAGFDLHKVWEPGQFAWIIPVLALVSAVLGFMGRRNVVWAQIAGGVPFIFLAYALYRYGSDVFSMLSVGGYITLLCGLFLVFVAPRIGKATGDRAGSA